MPLDKPNQTSWKKGQSGNPHGSKPKVSNAAMAIRFASKEHIHELYWKLLNANKIEVQEILANPTISVIEACILTAIIKDMEIGETKTIERMMDRVIGKPVNNIEHSGSVSLENLLEASYKKIE